MSEIEPKKIRLRIATCPLDDMNPADTYYCDIEVTEANIQAIDDHPKGFEYFMERYIAPAVTLIVDRYQQHVEDGDDAIRKTVDIGLTHLPRSIEFYREKNEMDKARRHAE